MRKPVDRAYYRLLYPLSCRPTLRIGAAAFAVADLSERGVRFVAAGTPPPEVGTEFEAELRLPTGEVVEVRGTVLWIRSPNVGVEFVAGVPFSVMLDQQRYLQRRLVAWS